MMTSAFQGEADLRQAGASPSGHSGAWWVAAEIAVICWAAAPGAAPVQGRAGLPWQPQVPAALGAVALFPAAQAQGLVLLEALPSLAGLQDLLPPMVRAGLIGPQV
jgi:hypothetical protein